MPSLNRAGSLSTLAQPASQTTPPARPMAADLYGDIEPQPVRAWRDHLRGLCVVAAATLAAGYLSDHYGAPLTLMALMSGLALNFLGTDTRLLPGIDFASRSLLRWGIILLGTRVTLGQMYDLGPTGLLAIAGILTLTIFAGIAMARMLGDRSSFGLLAGASVAICGASAALAVATALGERRVDRAQLAQVLVMIAAMSALAMFLYPILAHSLSFDDRQAGFLLGAAIHDVAQSIGAGYSYSHPAGDIAAIVKLTRVALLGPVLAILVWLYPSGDGGGRGRALPGFVIGFFALAIANSLGLVPPLAGQVVQYAATFLLAAAVAATGIRAPLVSLSGSGLIPVAVIGFATLVALLLSVTVAGLFMR